MRRFCQAFSSGSGLPANMDASLRAALRSLPDRYNIAVRKPAGVVFHDGDVVGVGEFAWGLVPRWSREPATKYTTVTARLERAPRSRIYRQAWEQRRCVVPMTGYFKWDRSVRPPVPHFIQSVHGEVLLAAGLWERWDGEGGPLDTFSILTHPNPAIPPPLVPDGPVFLPHDRWDQWLTGARWLPMRFLKTAPQPRLEAYPVSRAVRDPDRDDYTLLEPVDPRELASEPEPRFEDEDDDEALD